MQYQSNKHKSGEMVFSASSAYVDRLVPLSDMLVPGFFPARANMPVDSMVFLMGQDGWALVQCVGHTVEGHALLEQAQLVTVPVAAPPGNETLKLNRKAA